MRIGVVAPSGPLAVEDADRVVALAESCVPEVELRVHPQCFLTHNHFAGPDAVRADAFVEFANDPDLDAIWFARGGYGACRIAENVIARLGDAARGKTYLGYSDAGFLLAGLYRRGFRGRRIYRRSGLGRANGRNRPLRFRPPGRCRRGAACRCRQCRKRNRIWCPS